VSSFITRHVCWLPFFQVPNQQQYQAQIVLPCAGEQRVDQCVVEVARWARTAPSTPRLERVDVQVLHGGPDLGERRRPGAGVVRLRPSIRNGASSTSSAKRPSFFTTRGIGRS